MIKDLLTAIFLGILAGFAITAGLLGLKKNKTTLPPVTQITQISPTVTPEISPAITSNPINIDKPEDQSIVTTAKITLSGNTNPNSHVIIITPIDTYYVKASESGHFDTEISLESGANQIFISSIDTQDVQTDIELLVTYSTAKLSHNISLIKPAFAIEETDVKQIREVVQQKVNEKLKEITTTSPISDKKAFLGKIVSIGENLIVIDSRNKSISIGITDTTAIYDIKKVKTTFDKLKVGQDLLALCKISDNLIDGRRLLVVDTKTIQRPHLITIGKVADISKSSPVFTLIPINHKDMQYQIQTDSKTSLVDQSNNKLDLKELVLGKKIIVSLTPSSSTSKTYTANKIIIVQ